MSVLSNKHFYKDSDLVPESLWVSLGSTSKFNTYVITSSSVDYAGNIVVISFSNIVTGYSQNYTRNSFLREMIKKPTKEPTQLLVFRSTIRQLIISGCSTLEIYRVIMESNI